MDFFILLSLDPFYSLKVQIGRYIVFTTNFSIFDLQTSQPDELLPGLLEPTPQEELDQQNEADRKKDRVKQLYSVYLPNEEVGMFR